MKLSTLLLSGLLMFTIVVLLLANISIKKNYDMVEKDDRYWGYDKVVEQPFKHIHIEGGNITQIVFEQNDKPSVYVLRQWTGHVKAFVRKDTLFIDLPNEKIENAKLRDWAKHTTLVRIFAPELISVDGNNTDFDLVNLHQKAIAIHLSGDSRTEVETTLSEIDTLRVSEKDSSYVYFEMSPECKGNKLIQVQSAYLNLQGTSKLDLGQVQIKSLQLNIADSAVISLTAYSVKNLNR
jgi:hypothetical protein